MALVRGTGFFLVPVVECDLSQVLRVYEQCEDFLSLGPEPRASMSMVEADIRASENEGSIFCGIFLDHGEMAGIVEFLPRDFEGNPARAFLGLLMIAARFRSTGLGTRVVEVVETHIKQDAAITHIQSAVQVNNARGITFWERMGYRIVSEPQLQPDTTITYLLCKDLGEGR